MKKLIAIFLLFFLPQFAFAETAVVTVKGMVCSFCAQGIKKTFGKLDSVENTTVDLELKLVTLKLKSGKNLTDDEIKILIHDAGYEVLSVERKKDV